MTNLLFLTQHYDSTQIDKISYQWPCTSSWPFNPSDREIWPEAYRCPPSCLWFQEVQQNLQDCIIQPPLLLLTFEKVFSVTTCPALRVAGASSCLMAKAGCTLDKSPVHCRAKTERQTTTLRLENPHRHREKLSVQTLHRKARGWNQMHDLLAVRWQCKPLNHRADNLNQNAD